MDNVAISYYFGAIVTSVLIVAIYFIYFHKNNMNFETYMAIAAGISTLIALYFVLKSPNPSVPTSRD